MLSFTKLLIANRGEIACRVIRTARNLGYRTVAVCSEADRDALHARMADETVLIGPTPAAQSYLSVEAVLAAARAVAADAIHPGYGFLSENSTFARACADAGIRFVGPTPDAIDAMGDKAAAKRLMIAANVPCIPGYQGEAQDDATLLREAERIGRPLMVKAAAGGGGKGMRLVREGEALEPALRAARSEAMNAFGSDTLILERAIEHARHVEIQIFGDTFGNIVYLGERDCSVQRRHQKVLEEAPSPAVDPELRRRMGEAAVAAGRAVGYVGAGTVEFLLDADKNFYFLEMNTRLQVEHPVTEATTGLDLVEWQLRVAAGEPLPLGQDEIPLRGAAIEARLYAESPTAGFLPRTGPVLAWKLPQGTGVRVDHGLREGMEIGAAYDPMLAKVIAYGPTRADARRRLRRALEDIFLAGVETNRSFLAACVDAPLFVSGDATTRFIEQTFDDGFPAASPATQDWELAALLLTGGDSGWSTSGTQPRRCKLSCGDASVLLHLLPKHNGVVEIRAGDEKADLLQIIELDEHQIRYRRNGLECSARFARAHNQLFLAIGVRDFAFIDVTHAPPSLDEASSGSAALAPMPGKVAAVLVEEGAPVSKGQPVAILEAMKMEMEILAPRDGVIGKIRVVAGDQVKTRAVLIEIVVAESSDASA
jgi:geranyl-CoA carboxylase alpha subunit